MLVCKLKELIKQKNLTLQELSKKSHVKIITIRKYCDNKIQVIDFKTLNKLCIALKCSPNDIFKKS